MDSPTEECEGGAHLRAEPVRTECEAGREEREHDHDCGCPLHSTTTVCSSEPRLPVVSVRGLS